ncbi:TolC family protein [Candidatus Puniceispirillum sp.]|uniref:TolC family protein n=1 Tax=Candidatus Puniceispirillum sp. TaxID=2026719 RepID=UPI001EC8BC82|nr:TolC family protein [Candidatus Puniceispirillum sp.]
MKYVFRSLQIAFALCFNVMVGSTSAHTATLEDALRTSLVNSADLAAARQSWISARENIGVSASTSDLTGTIKVTGNQSHSDTSKTNGFDQSQYASGAITLSKNLYDGGQTAENTKLAHYKLDAETANYKNTEQALILRTIEAYLDVVKAQRDVRLHADNLARLESHVKAAEARVRAGASTPTRVAESKARYSRAQSDAIAASATLQNAKDMLHSLTGLELQDLKLPNALSSFPASLIEAETIARAEHPNIRKAIANEMSASQQFNALAATVKPTVNLSLSASSKYMTGTAGDLDVMSAQIVFSSPFLSTNATRAKSRSVSASHAQSKFVRDEAIRAVEVALRSAFRNMNTAQKRLDAVKSELNASMLVARGIVNEVTFGQKTILDQLDAEQDVNAAELRLVSAEHDVIIASYRLQAAMGRLLAVNLGLGDVLPALAELPAPLSIFDGIIPIRNKEYGQ